MLLTGRTMLDRSALARDINLLGEKLFSSQATPMLMSADEWKRVVEHQLFLATLDEVRQSQNLISWVGSLADVYSIQPSLKNYNVLAVDGSQVYPDRHLAGVGCYLLNAGGCLLSYGQTSKATLFSYPRVCVPEEIDDHAFATDLVDLKREAYEFEILLERAMLWQKKQGDTPLICLIDGSLVFWHLENKAPDVRDKFLSIYLDFLSKCKEHNIIIAGYLSLPKNKELVYLLQAGLCSYQAFASSGLVEIQKNYCPDLGLLTDAQLVQSFLPQHARTTLMSSCSNIVQAYPAVLKPHFFYLDVGKEVARVEVPAWIAEQQDLVNLIASVCIDQSIKGQGYPVALAESHEQAVIKSPDRDFFYHLICKIGVEQQRRIVLSQKSLKKRSMAV